MRKACRGEGQVVSGYVVKKAPQGAFFIFIANSLKPSYSVPSAWSPPASCGVMAPAVYQPPEFGQPLGLFTVSA